MLQNNFTQQTAQNNSVFTTHGTPASSPLIITWPHNGLWVPEEFYINDRPLGWAAETFETRHETHDLGVQALFETLRNHTNNTHIVSNISRLVVDHNRIAECAITTHSDDTGEAIQGNLNLTDEQVAQRIRDYHDPYHEEIDRVVHAAKAQHGYAAILDMHSFTRTFKNNTRDVCIGTIKPNQSWLSDLVEESLSEKCDGLNILFKPDAPYDIRLDENKDCPYTKRNAGQDIAARNGVDYLGIEICNDLLAIPERHMQTVRMIKALTLEIEAQMTPVSRVSNDHDRV